MSAAVKVEELNTVASRLKRLILEHKAHVAVVGVGYVGLPLAVEKARVGFPVVGIDENKRRVKLVNEGTSYIDDISSEELAPLLESGKLRAATDFKVLEQSDVIIICVPTPLTVNRDPDISYIINVTNKIAKYLRRGQLVVLESTTYPGTTEEVILPKLEVTGLKVGQDFFLAHSPERVDPGNQRYTTKNTNKVVGGVTPACLDVACTFYQQTIIKVIPVSSAKVAEMVKVFENTYRAVNIALVNELAMLCDRMGIDVWETLDAAFTKPFGIQQFYPGPGVGGHCIPIDPFYLTWKAREYDLATRFIELAGEINLRMPYFVVEKVQRALGKRGQALAGAKVLVLGVAYKKDVSDERESPAIKVIELLQREGAKVTYHDPLIPEIKPHGFFKLEMESAPLTDRLLALSDAVVIATDHSTFDYEAIVRRSKLVIDTRNATRGLKVGRQKVVKL